MSPFARALLKRILFVAAPVLAGCNSDATQRLECVPQLANGGCRTKTDPELRSEFNYNYCVEDILSVDELVSHDGQICCYNVTFDPDLASPCDGRPLREGERMIVAPARRGRNGWTLGIARPDVVALSPEQRAALAELWTTAAQAEHASIASFSRGALDLLACGAPATLVAAVQKAALDEVHHAALCFDLASAYAGAPIGPGPLPLGMLAMAGRDLATIAAETARDGCINETFAALLASERLVHAKDPAVRAALSTIAEDEMQHALLAWQTVRWALDVGGPDVRSALEEAFGEALQRASGDADPGEYPGDQLAEHGLLSAAAARGVVARAVAQIIRPSAEALLRYGRASAGAEIAANA
jgi:hypothetical protein